MAPGTTRTVITAVNGYLQDPVLPLPESLTDVLQPYIDKHLPVDDNAAQRLQDELLTIYHKDVANRPQRLAGFLAILRALKDTIAGYKRLLQWWDILVDQVVSHMGTEKGLAVETRLLLLDIMIFDADEGDKQTEAANTSSTLVSRLLHLWLGIIASPELDASHQFLQAQIKLTILNFGRKRPKELFTGMDKYFLQKQYRASILSLLGDFLRTDPPHLYQIIHTSLWLSLLLCLEIDTSTTVISLAMTILVMLLPHIPNSSRKHLPTLFKIYSRLLFWERERANPRTEQNDSRRSSRDESECDSSPSWEKLYYDANFDGDTTPGILNYFTFLYGLYPINFMSYIRKPERYLRHANHDDPDDQDAQPSEVRQRSEQFRVVHLLHPNFFSMTVKDEINDANRWKNSEAADVTASCMALYSGPSEYTYPINTIEPRGAVASSPQTPSLGEISGEASRANSSGELQPTTALDETDAVEGARNRWRDTATTLISPSRDEEAVTEGEHNDSETPIINQRADAKDEQSHEQITAYVQSIEESTSGTYGDESEKVKLLQRDVLLLRNDLNFERYLKQQHLSHISQLRSKHVQQVTVEAETQNLLSTNRALKASLAEAKSMTAQIRRETEKTRSLAKKWEADLTTKLRALKEEQKRWSLESEDLHRELAKATETNKEMRLMIVTSERRELDSLQKMQIMESSSSDADALQQEVEKLRSAIRNYEAKEVQHEETSTKLAVVEGRLHILEMQIDTQNAENAKIQARADRQRRDSRIELDNQEAAKRKVSNAAFQSMLDGALSTLKARLAETQKAHTQLQKRYVELEARHAGLQLSGGIDYINYHPRQGSDSGAVTPTTPTTPATTPGAYGANMGFPRSRSVPLSSNGKQQIFAVTADEDVPAVTLSGIRGRGGVQAGKRKVPKEDKKEEKKDTGKDNGPKFPSLRGIRGFGG